MHLQGKQNHEELKTLKENKEKRCAFLIQWLIVSKEIKYNAISTYAHTSLRIISFYYEPSTGLDMR